MNIKPMWEAVQSLNTAIYYTTNPEERKELEQINDQLRAMLRKRGVFMWQPTKEEKPE